MSGGRPGMLGRAPVWLMSQRQVGGLGEGAESGPPLPHARSSRVHCRWRPHLPGVRRPPRSRNAAFPPKPTKARSQRRSGVLFLLYQDPGLVARALTGATGCLSGYCSTAEDLQSTYQASDHARFAQHFKACSFQFGRRSCCLLHSMHEAGLSPQTVHACLPAQTCQGVSNTGF